MSLHLNQLVKVVSLTKVEELFGSRQSSFIYLILYQIMMTMLAVFVKGRGGKMKTEQVHTFSNQLEYNQ